MMQFLTFITVVTALLIKGIAGNGNRGYPLGDGAFWKHAELIISGYFTGNIQRDMIVKWSDGEVTLYIGGTTTDTDAPFSGETQMAKPGSIWTNAKGLARAAGGVVVLWSDGEVSFYRSVGKSGFGGEVQLIKLNNLWRDHASYIAGNGFDLIVVWSDGEVSQYTGIDLNKLSKEKQLAKPNDIWKHVRNLSSGCWDLDVYDCGLLVRWSDGELTVYDRLSTYGLGDEVQMKAPNELWTHATVVDGHGGGILVRWSDGRLACTGMLDIRVWVVRFNLFLLISRSICLSNSDGNELFSLFDILHAAT